jgi:hypothetical protein
MFFFYTLSSLHKDMTMVYVLCDFFNKLKTTIVV